MASPKFYCVNDINTIPVANRDVNGVYFERTTSGFNLYRIEDNPTLDLVPIDFSDLSYFKVVNGITNLDTFSDNNSVTNIVSNATGTPPGSGGNFNVFNFFGGATGVQLATQNNSTNLFIRIKPSATTGGSWLRMATIDDIPDLSPYALKITTITAGGGLTGGGDLSANRIINMGAPSSITLASGNVVSGTTHYHKLELGGTSSQYLRGDNTLATFPTIPQGTVTSVGMTIAGSALTVSPASINSSGTFSLTWSGTANQYVNGLGNLSTFPDLSIYELVANKVTNFTTPNNTTYPTTQAVNNNFFALGMNAGSVLGSAATADLFTVINSNVFWSSTITNGAGARGLVSVWSFGNNNYNFKQHVIDVGSTDNWFYNQKRNGIESGWFQVASRQWVTSQGYLTSNQLITLSGDVIGSGSTAITTLISNSAVTFPKIQNIPTQTLMGRYDSGSGNVQSITLGNGLSLSGTGVLSASGTIYTAGNGLRLTNTLFDVSRTTTGAGNVVTDVTQTTYGYLVTYGSITVPTVNDGILTMNTSGIATGSQTFTANSSTNNTFTVNVPGTNLGSSLNASNVLTITSSTGSNTTVNLSSLISPTPTLDQVVVAGNSTAATHNISIGAPMSSAWASPGGHSWFQLGKASGILTWDGVTGGQDVGGYLLFMSNALYHNTGSTGYQAVNSTMAPAFCQFTDGVFRMFSHAPVPAGTVINGSTGFTQVFNFADNNVMFNALIGTGIRMVVANAAGELSTQATPIDTNFFNADLTLPASTARAHSITTGSTLTIQELNSGSGFSIGNSQITLFGDAFYFGHNNTNFARFNLNNSTARTYTWQNANGTIAFLSDIPTDYVPTSRTITAGNGLTGGGNLTVNRTITLGNPGATTLTSTNSVTATSHTHAFTPGGTTAQYIRGDGTLATFPTIPTDTNIGNSDLTVPNGITRVLTLGNSALSIESTAPSLGSMTIGGNVVNAFVNVTGYQIYDTFLELYGPSDIAYVSLNSDGILIRSTNNISFSNFSNNSNTGNFSFTGLTANRTYTWQNKSGTVALLDDIPAQVNITGSGATTVSGTYPNIVISSTDTNTTYTAGNGLTLSGTVFSLPVTTSGSGNYVSNVTQTANGITVTKATLPTYTVTRLRANTSAYISGDISLLAGANTTLTQSGQNITIASTDTNTTYTAGSGLTLSGTVFSLPVTQSGSGNYVTSVVQTANGITVTKATLPTFTETDPIWTAAIPNTLTNVGNFAGPDFNTFTQTGLYYRHFQTPVMPNEPPLTTSEKRGVIYVTNSTASTGPLTQKFISESNRDFIRTSMDHGTTWTAWREMAGVDTIPTNYITTNTTQSGLSGNKSTSGSWLFRWNENAWYLDGQANQRLYVGNNTTNNNGWIFANANLNEEFQFRPLAANASVFNIGNTQTSTTNPFIIDVGNVASGMSLLSINQNGGSFSFQNATSSSGSFIPAIYANSNDSTGNYAFAFIGQGLNSYARGFYVSIRNAAGSGTVGSGKLMEINNYTTPYLSLSYNGVLTLPNLAGTGNRMVIANASGSLLTQAIPTVGSGVLTIQQNGSTVGTFSANATSNNTINLTGGVTEIFDNGYLYGTAISMPQWIGWDTGGGFAANVRVAPNGSYTVQPNDYTVYCVSSGTVIMLPVASSFPNRMIRLVNASKGVFDFSWNYAIYDYNLNAIANWSPGSILIQAINGPLGFAWYQVGGGI